MCEESDNDCRVPSTGALADVGPAFANVVGRVPSPGALSEPLPRRLRRLHRVWPDRDGNISYFLTICVEGRAHALANSDTFGRLTDFLVDSPMRYGWYPRRFVLMPDHLHLIAHQSPAAVRLGQWIKALKVVVRGLERRDIRQGNSPERPVGAPGLQGGALADVGCPRPTNANNVGRVPSPGETSSGVNDVHEFTRDQTVWRWQEGFHDHKFRSVESEQRKWEYICLNPVRYGLVARPEQWSYGGEIYYDANVGPQLVAGTPPLFETGLLMEPSDCIEDGQSGVDASSTLEGSKNGGAPDGPSL